MNRKDFESLTQVAKAYRVQVLALSNPYENKGQIDYGFRSQFYKDYDYTPFFQEMVSRVSPDIPVDFIDNLDIHYLILENPEPEVSGQETANQTAEQDINFHYLILGPFILNSRTMAEVHELFTALRLPPEAEPDVYSFFNRIPVITDIMAWYSMMNYFFSLLMGSSLLITECNYKSVADSRLLLGIQEINPDSRTSYAMIEKRYEIQDAMLDAVRDGNVDEALRCSNAFYGFTLPPRMDDPLREGKNMAFVVQALLRYTVQAAYVHPLHIDNLSSQLAPQIESLTSAPQVRTFITTMIRKYCFLVRSYSRKNHSTLIRNCLDYIDFYYMEELSLNELAKRYAVSKGYLSACFHKEVDMTVTDYIHATRVRQSIRMLNTTDLPIQTIAERCGYPDSNYYTRVFKKITGQSPQQYRKGIRR